MTCLPPEQVPAFKTLLQPSNRDRNEIQTELNQIYKILDEFGKK